MSSEHYEGVIDFALSKAEKESEYAEVYIEDDKAFSFAIEQGRLNGSASSEKVGLRIRIISNGCLYTVSTNNLEKGNIEKLISRFRKFKGKKTALSEEKSVSASYVVKEKKAVDEESMLKALMSVDKGIAEAKHIAFRGVYGSFDISDTYFANSDGSKVHGRVPIISAFVNFIVKGAGTRQRFMQFGGAGGYEVFDPSKIEKKVLEEADNMHRLLEKGRELSASELAGIKNVVISPEISGIAVHESVGHPNEADRVFGREAAQAGESYINAGNLGLRIGSDAVTIIDDPTVKNAYGYFEYDDEGVRARPKVIVEKGLQKELLVNREYAHELGIRSNASARSSAYAYEPIVRMSNTYLKPGRASLDELIEEAGNGIYIKSFTEWNIDDTRSFARYQGNEAYMIKNGSIEEPVKNYRLEIKTLDFWHAVKLVGRDFSLYLGECGKGEPMQGVPVTMGGGSALLRFG
ncbi:MAG: TldD/PmbA family protein [Candidatus Micrarchaeia archaeon]